MWSLVGRQDSNRIRACCELMTSMDRFYARNWSPGTVEKILDAGGEILWYEAPDGRIAVFLEKHLDGETGVLTAGFTGSLSARQALDLAVAELVKYMCRNKLRFVRALRREGLDHGPLNDAFDLAQSHPDLRVRELSREGRHVLWEVAPAAACSDKGCIWTWDGTMWNKTIDCPSNCSCPKPTNPGTFIGQNEVRTCQAT